MNNIDDDALDGLNKLTQKQYAFFLGLIDPDLTDIAAYERAYPGTTMSKANKAIEAVRLKNNPKISPALKALKLQGLGQSIEDRVEHVQRLRELSQQAQEAGNYGAAVNAEVNAGKVAGHYIERTENVNETRKQELKERISLLTNDETEDKSEDKLEALH